MPNSASYAPSPLDTAAPFPVLLAPMVGLTHLVVRRAIQEYLPAGARSIWPTEMLNSRRLPSEPGGRTIETRFEDRDAGLCPQLLGNEESFVKDSIAKLRDWGARGIDINMGCPVKRALTHNYGVALLGDPDYAAEVTAMAVKHAGGLPVSVKLRAAPPPKEIQKHPLSATEVDPGFLKNVCQKIEAAGASWITLHPRTAAQLRRGEADWSQIKSLKEWLKIPVIGNGDVQTPEEIRRMFSETGCDRVMIGRALLAKPWMLRSAIDPSAELTDPHEAGREYGRFLKRVLELSREHYPESAGVRRFRFLLLHGSPYLEYGHTLYASVTSATSYDDVEACLVRIFGERGDRPQRLFPRTDLRR